MKILVIGATRGIGKKLAELAADEGHEVTVLVRSASKLQGGNPRLHVMEGDILDPASVTKAIAGQDAICVCIGIPLTRKPVHVFSDGIKNVLSAIGDNTEQTLIVVTGIGAGDSKGHGGFMYDQIINPLLLKEIYKDKDRQEDLIRASQSNWIIVRPGMLTNGARTGNYRAIDNLEGVTSRKISRADVADFILKQAKEPTFLRKTPLLTD